MKLVLLCLPRKATARAQHRSRAISFAHKHLWFVHISRYNFSHLEPEALLKNILRLKADYSILQSKRIRQLLSSSIPDAGLKMMLETHTSTTSCNDTFQYRARVSEFELVAVP